MAGILQGVVKSEDKEVAKLFTCNIVHFTGNCGIKAIDHLWFLNRKFGKEIDHAKEYEKILSIIESFLWHKTNCGYLIGSDTCAKGYKGQTLLNIENYGTNYHISEPTWNPNYTWDSTHKVVFFFKDLNQTKHVNYWDQAKPISLKGASQEISAQLQ